MPRNGCESTGTAGDGAINSGACMHPDDILIQKGVPFNVRYTGCLEVLTSMKSLDFQTRTLVARECINRVCEAAGLKSAGKRRIDKKISQYIAERPCMRNAGTNVIINVSSRALQLINAETGEILSDHIMPRISFASGGDSDTLDFLAYIAKNEDEWRACYVLECLGAGQSEDLIITIGRAFMLRFDALNKKTQNPSDNYNRGKENEKDYYNDLPNKLPPDLLSEDDLEQQQKLLAQQQQQLLQEQKPTRQHQSTAFQQTKLPQQQQQKVSQLNLKKPRERLSSNLIDLNSPPPDQTTNKINLSSFDPMHSGNHDVALSGAGAVGGPASGLATPGVSTANQAGAGAPVRDVFDLQPFSLSAEVQRSQLIVESWYHGAVSRAVAEGLLRNDGDFLVRESQGKHNQYVLTGLEGKTPKHLLLIDPEGVVRTKDRIFDSISHLINYHWTNSLPIISEDSELVLRNPILRQGLATNSPSLASAIASTSTSTVAMQQQQQQHHLHQQQQRHAQLQQSHAIVNS